MAVDVFSELRRISHRIDLLRSEDSQLVRSRDSLIVRAVERGHSYQVVAEECGITKQAVMKALRRGRSDEQ